MNNRRALDLKARLDGGDLSVQGELDALISYGGVGRLVQLPLEILRTNKVYDDAEMVLYSMPKALSRNM